ncbi:myeloid differentiation primary response protein MyD88 isoform X1 [Bombyx mori]|uniref:Death domain-containing protein n=1 Tax=Bombyx mori TaxID=7091 RepID=A0A8R1WE39_BOMMO|nr:myeloid differentiation primary response protein MyD88 isoform X1 [Bombyx mori]
MQLKMASDSDINNLPLLMIPYKTRQMLSCLLNTKKIIPSDGPDKLPRDWRGLASLVGISSQEAGSIHQCSNKTDKVLEIWQRNGSPTVGQLLEFLQRLDRFDVHDDVIDDLRKHISRGELTVNQPAFEGGQVAIKHNDIISNEDVYVPITIDDDEGYEQHYDAFVLYADEDREFVEEMINRLGGMFQICTKEKLLPSHSTEYAPVAQLISQRCQYIILVYSPAFLRSPANTFYRDYAQAISIESRNRVFEHKLIPIVYQHCELPVHLKYYTNLKYTTSATFNFWDKLKQSLRQHRIVPSFRLDGATSSRSALNIVELTNSNNLANSHNLATEFRSESHFFRTPDHSIVPNGHDSNSARSEDTLSWSGDYSQASDGVERMKNLGRRFMKVLKRKKT